MKASLFVLNEVLVVLMALLCYMLGRNEAVHHFIMRMLAEESEYIDKDLMARWRGSFRRLDALPSYNVLLLKFWVPLERYRRPLELFYLKSKIPS